MKYLAMTTLILSLCGNSVLASNFEISDFDANAKKFSKQLLQRIRMLNVQSYNLKKLPSNFKGHAIAHAQSEKEIPQNYENVLKILRSTKAKKNFRRDYLEKDLINQIAVVPRALYSKKLKNAPRKLQLLLLIKIIQDKACENEIKRLKNLVKAKKSINSK